MRTIKELLELMLENKNLFRMGLCQWASDLHWTKVKTTRDEYDLLLVYIQNYRPSMFSSIDAFKCRKELFYWPAGKRGPRIRWIKKHIKKNS